MTKDVIDAIKERRSVRNFKSDPIPDPTIDRILECGRMAPSAGNIEPWFFYVVKNKEIIDQLASISEPWLNTAPVVIVITADINQEMKKYGQRGRDLYVLQDTAAAAQNMLLAAQGFGIGSTWVGDFDELKVREIIGIPDHQRPVVIIPFGYPATDDASHIPHKSIDQIVKVLN